MTVYLVEQLEDDHVASYGKASIADHVYATGRIAPHFPMPAIPLEVDITSKYVVAFEWIGPEMTGEYIVETMLAIHDDCYFGPYF